MNHSDLIHDWNDQENGFDYRSARVVLNDETLRDGLQSPSVIDPPMDAKVRLLHLMAAVGVRAADIGLPGAGPRVVEQVRALAREIVDQNLPIDPNCAARTVVADIQPIVDISQEVGLPIEAATFIGSSAIRQFTEHFDRGLARDAGANRNPLADAIPLDEDAALVGVFLVSIGRIIT